MLPKSIRIPSGQGKTSCSGEIEPIIERLEGADVDGNNEVTASELGVSDEQFTKAKTTFEEAGRAIEGLRPSQACPERVSNSLRDVSAGLKTDRFISHKSATAQLDSLLKSSSEKKIIMVHENQTRPNNANPPETKPVF